MKKDQGRTGGTPGAPSGDKKSKGGVAGAVVVVASAAFAWAIFRPRKPQLSLNLRELPAGAEAAEGADIEPALTVAVAEPVPPLRIAVATAALPLTAAELRLGRLLHPQDLAPAVESVETAVTFAVPAFGLQSQTPFSVPAFFSSLALHCLSVVLVPLVAGLLPETPHETPAPHYSFRMLQLAPPPELQKDAAPSTLGSAVEAAVGSSEGAAAAQPDTGEVKAPSRFRFDLPFRTGETTLVQLDIPATEARKDDVRVPDALVWAKKAPKAVITPPPEVETKPLIAAQGLDLPRPDLPQPERPTPAPATVVAVVQVPVITQRSPVAVDTTEPGKQVPETPAPASKAKSSGQLISVSDVALPPEALIAVPSVSQVARPRSTSPGPPGSGSTAGSGASKTPDAAGQQLARTAVPPGPASAEKTGTADARAAAGPPAGAATATPPGAGVAVAVAKPLEPGAVRIDRSMTGRHTAVVLGGSSAETYPESAGVLACRVVYTVYVQVGLPKSWMLQYCLAGSPEQTAARGAVSALDAPWPFVLIRPSLAELSGDYTVVHGFVNAAGQFENLSLVTPDEGAKTALLEPLKRWEFRPTTRDGKPTTVEILLIIPHRKN